LKGESFGKVWRDRFSHYQAIQENINRLESNISSILKGYLKKRKSNCLKLINCLRLRRCENGFWGFEMERVFYYI
jgi:hypothetical protein